LTQISSRARVVADHSALGFGVVKPPIFQFWDDDHRSNIRVLEAADCPQQGVTSYATVGLSEHALIRNGTEFPTRVEFLGACGSAFPNFNNVVATAAFCIINSNWFCAPGVIFPDIVRIHGISITMSDIYFANPFLWNGAFGSETIDGRTTAWLLAVPISKAEAAYAGEHGPQKLEELFSQRDIDIYNLNRTSVV
jgi:hypothetical protein